MNLVNATYVEMAPEFGQGIRRSRDPVSEAADWLWATHLNQRKHAYVLVQACQVQALEPVGVARIDKMLKEESETGFMSGNASTNLQSSFILPAWSCTEVNGFTEFDGVKIGPGDLLKNRLWAIQRSEWNERQDKQALQDIEGILMPRSGLVPGNESTTVIRVLHMRDKATRHEHRVPVITHGWMLVGDRGQIHYRKQLNSSSVSTKLMDRAAMALSCERYNSQDLLKIQEGKFVHVDQSVLDYLTNQGNDISGIDLSHREIVTKDASETSSESGPNPRTPPRRSVRR